MYYSYIAAYSRVYIVDVCNLQEASKCPAYCLYIPKTKTVLAVSNAIKLNRLYVVYNVYYDFIQLRYALMMFIEVRKESYA